jgi:hypothetical protein
MLWTRIVGVLVLLVAATYLVQWLAPRGGKREIPRKQYLRWDVAPIVGFFGALLLALSFAQAATNQVIEPWVWGDIFGLLVSVGAWVLFPNRPNRAARGRPSVWQSIRRYGTLVIAGVIGIYLAVRVFGAALEVFVAAALGTFIIAAAVAIFVGNKSITEERNGK